MSALILTFQNTRTAIKAEKLLRDAGFALEVIPTPRHISAECGMSLRVAAAEAAPIEELLQQREIAIVALHKES